VSRHLARKRRSALVAAVTDALVSALREIGYRPRVISGDAQFDRRLADPHGQWNISDGDWTADYPGPLRHNRGGGLTGSQT
jgi:hypothetical protein